MTKNKTIYARLGIKPMINAQGTYTVLGGSVMPHEVVQAMVEAAQCFVSIPELQQKVGARIAALVGVPAAMVTAGAASAITVATAACMTRDNLQALEHLPRTDGLKNEVVIQKGHKCGYEHQILLTGAKLVWVETRADLQAALNQSTAMMFFLNRYEPLGQIKREEWIRVGKELPRIDYSMMRPPTSHRLLDFPNTSTRDLTLSPFQVAKVCEDLKDQGCSWAAPT